MLPIKPVTDLFRMDMYSVSQFACWTW